MPRDVSLKFLPGLRIRVCVDARKQSQQGISCDLLERTRNLNEMLDVGASILFRSQWVAKKVRASSRGLQTVSEAETSGFLSRRRVRDEYQGSAATRLKEEGCGKEEWALSRNRDTKEHGKMVTLILNAK